MEIPELDYASTEIARMEKIGLTPEQQLKMIGAKYNEAMNALLRVVASQIEEE